jgi:hypothetical protein
MNYKILYITLRRLIGERNVAALRSQLLQHGAPLFARALALGSARIIADALSLLPIAERISVLRHLPAPIRAAMHPLCSRRNPRFSLPMVTFSVARAQHA